MHPPQTVSEKPFLDVALSADGTTALAAATDRTVTLHDLRTSATTAVAGTFAHQATPSCVVVSPAAGTHQLATGAYDGLVRVWDLRSTSAAVASFRPAWEAGAAKVLALDWYAGVIAVGGEGGLEVWKAGEGSA
jgi:ribosome biogenesis protein